MIRSNLRAPVQIPLYIAAVVLTLVAGPESASPWDGTAGEPTQQAPQAQPSTLPAGHPAVASKPSQAFELPPVREGSGAGESGLTWAAPVNWIAEPPSNPMRRAQYRIPGPGGDGECVVFYFGPGQGGDPKANATRWASQFSTEDGRPGAADMKTRELTANGVPVLFVEVKGSYTGGGAMGGTAPVKPHYALLGAVASGPDANWFFKLVGPEATIEAARAAFEELLRSLQKGNSQPE